ncbi:aminotransferase class III-fold pyridoxal phosphate-dependent enzyme [Streptomyces sp. NPDC006140]|uniref:aminotransferase class III-fold pyridoxal phosphate-dependent enzyme n=1 Tax=Streptomyces sp. NPDC006140 TaxID=3154579 RepID=UPI00340941B0
MEPLLQEIAAIVGDYFDVQPERLYPDVAFADLGDSMSLLGMAQRLEDRYGCKVPLRQLFTDVQTLPDLAAYLLAHASTEKLPRGEAISPATTATTTASSTDAVASSAPAPVLPQSIDSRPPVTAAPSTELSMDSALSPGASTAVQDLIKEQLVVMQRQLQLLAGSGPGSAADPAMGSGSGAGASPPVALSPVRPVPARSVVPLAPGARSSAISPVETAERTRYLKKLGDRLSARTKGSKECAQRFRTMVADSRSTVGFRPSIKEMLYPIVAERGQGSRLWDIDGNEYVDLTLGYGVHLLGHNPPAVMSAIRERLDVGFSLGPRTQLVEEVAAGVLELTGMERVAFLNSGTEAVMTAVRLARAATGRDKIVVFSTAYHGHFDSVLAVPAHENGVFGTRPLAPGISPHAVENVYVLEFGTDEALDFINKHGADLAAVLTEPVTLRTPGVQKPDFLRAVREVTRAHGTKLIFDEMVTGFRCHPAGVQGLYGIEADLATYGKIVGGGMPIGVIAGRGGVMDSIDGGVWNFGDDSGPRVESTFFGGTFNQHPLTMATAKAVLDHLRAEGPDLQRNLDRKTAMFTDQLNADFRELEVPIEAHRFSSMFKFEHQANMDPFYFNLLVRGVFVWELRNFFLSTAHEQDDLDHIRTAVRESVEELRDHGMLGSSRTEPAGPLPRAAAPRSTHAQRQLRALDRGGVPAFEMSVGFWLDGSLNRVALRAAVQDLVARHETLRTTFGSDGDTLVVHPVREMPLSDVLTEYTCGDEDDLSRFLRTWAERPLDPVDGEVFRAAVVEVNPQRHLLLVTVHHAAVDGWSYSVLLDDLAAMYNARCRGTSPELPPAVQFRDYVTWHERITAGPTAAKHRDFWHSLLEDVPAPELPSLGKLSQFPYRAVRHRILLDPEFCGQMRDTARNEGVTVFAYLVAAWGALLQRLTGQDKILVPVASARRPQELDRTVGYCSNLLPLVFRRPDDTLVADYVGGVLMQLVTGLERQDYPFAELITDFAPPGAGLRSKLFTTAMSFYRQVAVPPMDGLTVSEADSLPITHTGNPLALNIVDSADGFRCEFDAAVDIVDPDLVERLPRYYRNLLSAMVANNERPLGELDHEGEEGLDGSY